jgi:WD40 repeat protein
MIGDIAVSPSGSRLFVSEFAPEMAKAPFHTRVIDLETRKESYRIANSSGPAVLSPNGRFVAMTNVGLFPRGTHLNTKLLDPKTGRELHSFKDSDALTWAPSFSPNSKLMAFPAADKTVRVWDIQEKKFILTQAQKSQPDAVQFLPDGKLFAIDVDGKTVKLWHVTDAKLPVRKVE